MQNILKKNYVIEEKEEKDIVCSLIITSSIWLMQFSNCSHFEIIFIPSVIHIEHLLCIKL